MAAPKKADKSLRDEVTEVVSEEERRRILAEQAPRVAEAKARVANSPPQAQPVTQPVTVEGPADEPLTSKETGGLVEALRNHEPFKTMHALITKNARTADKALKGD